MGIDESKDQGRRVKTPAGWDDADWDEIRQAIVVASATLEIEDEMSLDTIRKIWAERAEQLAQIPVEEEVGERLQLIQLRLGREIYGVDVQCVSDIRPLESLTPVPRVPVWVAGVVNLRGHLYSVIDLCQFLGLLNGAMTQPAEASVVSADSVRYLVVVQIPAMEVALLVDEVLPMVEVPVSTVREAVGTVRGIRTEYLRGIADASTGAPMVILDLPTLLADKQLVIREDVT